MNRIVVLIFLMFVTSFCNANSFIVSTNQGLQKILNKVKPGDSIIWQNGVYKDERILFYPTHNGTEKNPIVLCAENPGKVVFYGNSQMFLSGDYLIVEGFKYEGECTLSDGEPVISFSPESTNKYDLPNHCRVTNCAIINYSLSEESGKNNNYVAMGGTYNELDHCSFSGKINKGPTVVVNYFENENYIKGSDQAPSTYHHIHHNYFGYRTYSSNGGEQIRVGVSGTSGTKGFNLIEYNYFEETKIEAEVISNKSCNNVYRFNTLVGNDGALVLRHGTDCIAYGNYIVGNKNNKISGGIRIVNPRQLVFNNYIENIEGADRSMKASIVVMSGFEGAGINEYYPADKAIVAYNTITNASGNAIKLSVGNVSKGKSLVAPKDVLFIGNLVQSASGNIDEPFKNYDEDATYKLIDNFVTSNFNINGFSILKSGDLKSENGLISTNRFIDFDLKIKITKSLKSFKIDIDEKDISNFNSDWIVTKKNSGASWMNQ
jgi:poly(beta-D-mannuronate) lyase